MTFIECIVRIMRSNAIIRGDTDAPTTFNDVQHNATINIGIIAVQNELVELIADRLIPKERRTSGSITLATNTRVYDLASGFIRFFGTPHLFNSGANRQLYEYPGGIEKLQTDVFNYATQYGAPHWWYSEAGNASYKQIGLFPVPSSAENGQGWAYDYETSTIVSASSDTLPFYNDEENYTFTDMASRRFRYMYEDTKNEADISAILMKDQSYRSAKARLMNLARVTNPQDSYGFNYA